MGQRPRTIFAVFTIHESAAPSRQRRCNCCGERMDGLALCWNPACADSVHDGVRAGWPAGGEVIVTTGASVR